MFDVWRDKYEAGWKAVERWVEMARKPASPLRRREMRLGIAGIATVAAVGAYVLQPTQRFADFGTLLGAGFLAAAGLIAALVLPNRRLPVMAYWLIVFQLAFASLMFVAVATEALSRSGWNDLRCLRIQSMMLKPTPRARRDLPELFTALGCRPQGEGPEDPNHRAGRDVRPSLEAQQASAIFLRQALANEVDVEVEANSTGVKVKPQSAGRVRVIPLD